MYIYGAGGHARSVRDVLTSCKNPIEGIYDDNPAINVFMGLPVLHSLAGISEVIICVGNNNTRKFLAERLALRGVTFGQAIHANAIISPYAEIGEGTVVMPGAIVNSGARVGRHCIINSGAVVEHDCQVGDFTHIASHATLGGGVTVGEGGLVSAGAIVTLGLHIGSWSTIGAGSVVIRDIPDGVVAYGDPCRVIRNTDSFKTEQK